MVATLEALLKLRDEMTGPLMRADQNMAKVAAPGGGMGSLMKTAVGTAGGFIAAQVSVTAFEKGLSASVGSAMKYEAQMAQLRALTGATGDDTDALKVSIREMQKTLPKSSAELGAGAYFILSSGITDAADAAEVLEIAAKASAVGLGETAVVADAITTVLNAYGKEASEAGRVTDVLMQAVKDGKAEASAFSNVLGTVVPMAKNLGISFEEVAANLATFTRLGVSAEEAATGLRGVMNQLLSPSEQARDLLASVGITMDELRASIKERGLAVTLQDLMEKFHGNEEALSTLFPEVRGLTNVLAVTGAQMEDYLQILGNMDTATGNLDRGFADVSNTAKFKFDKALNDLNVSLMQIGSVSLPLVAGAAQEAAGIFSAIADPIGALEKNFVRGAKGVGGYAEQQREAARATEDLGLSLTDINAIQVDQIETGQDLAGVVGNVAGQTEVLTEKTEGLGGAAVDTDTKVSNLYKDLVEGARDAISAILPTADEFGQLAETTLDNADAVARWQERLADFQSELGPLQEELSRATDPEDVERLTKRIGELQAKMAETPADIAPVVSGFDTWRQRVSDMAADYGSFKDNMQTIMDTLVSQQVTGVGDIMAVVREQGPEFAANFAQWFRDDPIAAATTVKEIMPGIMGEAAKTAIDNVLAETSRFNTAWQTDVIGALNALPEEKKVAITSNIDPQFWLLAASLAAMEPGLNIPFTMEDLQQMGDIPRQHGGPVQAGVRYRVGEAGEETFIPGMNGVILPHSAPLLLPPPGAGWSGGGSGDVNVYLSIGQLGAGVTRENVRELADMLKDEYRDDMRRGR